MSDTRSQLAEVDGLIAADPDDPAFQQLREDLLQLIALEEQESVEQTQQPSNKSTHEESHPLGVGEAGKLVEDVQNGDSVTAEQTSSMYTAQGTFMEHFVSKGAIAEAPDLGSFQPVLYSKSQPALKSGSDADADALSNLKDDANITNAATTTTTNQSAEKKQKKKKQKSDDAVISAKFELPSHLVPLESDTPAQKLKKQRTAKALKSKFREKQKEAEHSKRQHDWKSFATKATGGKKRTGVVVGSGSIFSTEEGVNARVGVISGGGGRKMTDFADPNKRHKFT